VLAQAGATPPHHGAIVGHGEFRYRVDKLWCQADKAKHPVKDCHEMVQAGDGRLYLITKVEHRTPGNLRAFVQVTIRDLNSGALIDQQGRLVRFGLGKGTSDLIGLRSVVVSPEMVGQRLAQFVALEIKTARGVVSTRCVRPAKVVSMRRAWPGSAGLPKISRPRATVVSEHSTGAAGKPRRFIRATAASNLSRVTR
jgi:hypothetical protein